VGEGAKRTLGVAVEIAEFCIELAGPLIVRGFAFIGQGNGTPAFSCNRLIQKEIEGSGWNEIQLFFGPRV